MFLSRLKKIVKQTIKDIVVNLLWLFKVTHPSRYAKDKLVVLTFHRVLTEEQRNQYPLAHLAVSEEELDWICSEVKKHFHCQTMTETHDDWLQGKSEGKPLIALTFDDGQYDNYAIAHSVLKKNNLPATFYIPVTHIDNQRNIWHDIASFCIKNCLENESKRARLQDLLNRNVGDVDLTTSTIKFIVNQLKQLTPENRIQVVQELESISDCGLPDWSRMMSWNEIRELSEYGHEIGSHSMTHALMTQLGTDDLKYEILTSSNQLKERLDIEVNSFCYPNGNYNESSIQIVKESGYSNAVSTVLGLNSEGMDSYSLKRIDIDPYTLRNTFNNLSVKHLHFRLSNALSN